MSKYILVTGAPGSRWSGFVEDCLYTLPNIDTTDRSPEREYWTGYDGCRDLLHRGAYFDPGMEFGNFPEDWDKPFSGEGQRIIKSHTFSYQLDYLKTLGHDIYMVWRPDDECFDWWHQAGGWNITYPNYSQYENDEVLREQIRLQNKHILQFAQENNLRPFSIDGRTFYKWNSTENG